MDPRSQLYDQLIDEARNGCPPPAGQNGAQPDAPHHELRMLTKARASLDELLLDLEVFLSQHRLAQWKKDDPLALEVRAVARSAATTSAAYAPWLQHQDPGVVANTLLCLIHQANYLMDQQLRAAQPARAPAPNTTRGTGTPASTSPSRPASPPASARSTTPPVQGPACPRCGQPMLRRTARKGPHVGEPFWGCSAYPSCRSTLPIDGPAGAQGPNSKRAE